MDQTKKYYRSFAYVAGFFLSIHLAFPSYFNASFLSRFVSESNVGLIFSLASFLSILALSNISRLIIKFGKLKVAFDVTLVICGLLFSFILFHRLNGIREGTVLAALLVGTLVHLINKRLSFMEAIFKGEHEAEKKVIMKLD